MSNSLIIRDINTMCNSCGPKDHAAVTSGIEELIKNKQGLSIQMAYDPEENCCCLDFLYHDGNNNEEVLLWMEIKDVQDLKAMKQSIDSIVRRIEENIL